MLCLLRRKVRSQLHHKYSKLHLSASSVLRIFSWNKNHPPDEEVTLVGTGFSVNVYFNIMNGTKSKVWTLKTSVVHGYRRLAWKASVQSTWQRLINKRPCPVRRRLSIRLTLHVQQGCCSGKVGGFFYAGFWILWFPKLYTLQKYDRLSLSVFCGKELHPNKIIIPLSVKTSVDANVTDSHKLHYSRPT